MKKQEILNYLKRRGVNGALDARRIAGSREFRFHPNEADITSETVQKWIEAHPAGSRPASCLSDSDLKLVERVLRS
jgi:hypothetical protein